MTHDPNASARQVRTLPARPSLEHLKNEAKQRLKALRQRDPGFRVVPQTLIVGSAVSKREIGRAHV